MHIDFRFLTKKRYFISTIILIVIVLTAINNFYFYVHVEKTLKRNAYQLEDILKDEISFCRKNRISEKRYVKHIFIIMEDFWENGYYVDKISLRHETKGEILLDMQHENWDKVVGSSIDIIIPKLKTEYPLYFQISVKYDYIMYLYSIVRSMTFSLSDYVININTETVTEEDEVRLKNLNKIKEKYYEAKTKYNNLLKQMYMGNIHSDNSDLIKSELKFNEMKYKWKINKNNYKELNEEVWDSYDWYIALLRSRPAIGFAIFTFILIWLFKIREKEVAKEQAELKQKAIEAEHKAEEEKRKREELEKESTEQESDKVMKILKYKNFSYEEKSNELAKLIESGVDINALDKNGMTTLMTYAFENISEEDKYKTIEILINNGAKIDYRDKDGMTALMLYAINNKNDEYSKVISLMIKYGAKIDEKNRSGMTALMLCSQRGLKKSVEILIDSGADINLKQEVSAEDLVTDLEIKEIFQKVRNNNPQKLVKSLSSFTKKPMKFTTHNWDFGSLENVFGSFDDAMKEVEKQFKSIEDDLQNLSPSLYKKINTFLFDKNLNNYSWCSKTFINVGWSNLYGLRDYCNSGKNPFDFVLEEPILMRNKEISTFGEVINLFKQEIEIRTDFKNLEAIFSYQKKKLGRGFRFDLSQVQLGKQFYTDTQFFSDAIGKIFSEIKKRKEYPEIELTITELSDKSIEIKIIQVGSIANKDSLSLIKEINNGDFEDIKEKIENLCDWSVEAICLDGNFRINYLYSRKVEKREKLEESIKGFTHILRFYR